MTRLRARPARVSTVATIRYPRPGSDTPIHPHSKVPRKQLASRSGKYKGICTEYCTVNKYAAAGPARHGKIVLWQLYSMPPVVVIAFGKATVRRHRFMNKMKCCGQMNGGCAYIKMRSSAAVSALVAPNVNSFFPQMLQLE